MGTPPNYGASDEARTRYLHLGKVALYQMSYTRNDKGYDTREKKICQGENDKYLLGICEGASRTTNCREFS